jgi:hypothetical protein
MGTDLQVSVNQCPLILLYILLYNIFPREGQNGYPTAAIITVGVPIKSR